MRLAGVEKVGYYPTPAHTLRLIAQLLTTTKNSVIRLLDPCAGQGEALAFVCEHLRSVAANVTSYAVEVSHARAVIANDVIDQLIMDDWNNITSSRNAHSLLWLNPPYDFDVLDSEESGRKNRQEYLFLQSCTPKLQPGGVLVYIVPQSILARPNVAKFISTHYEQVRAYRLPDGEYETFKQAVLIGYRKQTPFIEEDRALKLCTAAASQLPALDQAQASYSLPTVELPDAKLIFRRTELSIVESYDLVRKLGCHNQREWKAFSTPKLEFAFRPVVPLKVGHVGSLISSGQMGVINLGNLVAKGYSVKVKHAYSETNQKVELGTDDAAKLIEKFETRIYTLNAAGEHHAIHKIDEFQTFLDQHAERIGQIIGERYHPIYQQPTANEWKLLSSLMPKKKLPGRAAAGLLDTQKHVAAAAARSCRFQGWVDIIGEMGTGKTATSLATVALLDAFPALVLCPGHMVEKWKREIEEVIPGATGVILEDLTALMSFVQQVRNQPNRKFVAVISKERAKLGAGWEPATQTRLQRVSTVNEQTGERTSKLIHIRCCAQCGAPVEVSKDKRLCCTNKVKRLQQGEWQDVECSAPLYQFGKLHRWPVSDYIRKHLSGFFKAFVADECHQYKGKATDQAEAYHQLSRACRWTINLTGTLFGGKSTDLFWLRHRVDSEVRRDYKFSDESRWSASYGRLEETLNKVSEEKDGAYSGKRRYAVRVKEIPGISPSIFRRVLKSCIFVKVQDLGFKMPAYNEHIIRLAMNEVQHEQYQWLYDTLYKHIQDGMKSYDRIGMKEAQALLSVWLQNCLSRPNSGFRSEEVWWKPPANDQDELSSGKQPYLVPLGDAPLTPEPLSEDELATVGLTPDDDDDKIMRKVTDINPNFVLPAGMEPMVLRPVVVGADLLPKEEWLLNTIQQEQAQGRKVLIYVRQTGTRDIQPHLQRILKRVGIRASILDNSIAPSKREAWINSHIDSMDALITNPKKVETGLDLVAFSTCIFYELDYSLFTLWQAMRRVWRLGQTNPVKVLFPIYAGTLEDAALSLMGEKMKAACLLYGDSAASAITDEAEVGSGDFMAELAHRILEGKEIASNGVTGLLKQMVPDMEVEDESILIESFVPESEVSQTTTISVQSVEFAQVDQSVVAQPFWMAWAIERNVNLKEIKRKKTQKKGERANSDDQLGLVTVMAPDLQLSLFNSNGLS